MRRIIENIFATLPMPFAIQEIRASLWGGVVKNDNYVASGGQKQSGIKKLGWMTYLVKGVPLISDLRTFDCSCTLHLDLWLGLLLVWFLWVLWRWNLTTQVVDLVTILTCKGQFVGLSLYVVASCVAAGDGCACVLFGPGLFIEAICCWSVLKTAWTNLSLEWIPSPTQMV